ncbi:MAG: nucleotide-binding protein [Chloroflexi bacterium]|nr:nucleotide-binding protein [Chloroflexota bacterium]
MTKENLYNVRIRFKDRLDPTEFRYKLTLDYLERVVVSPYRNREHIVLDGRIIAPDDIWSINIKRTKVPTSNPSLLHRIQYVLKAMSYSNPSHAFEDEGMDVTDEFIAGPSGSRLVESGENVSRPVPAADTRRVFVVHGRNSAARDALFVFIRAIGLQPLEWSEAVQATGKPLPYIGEILDVAFSTAHAVVVLHTPDDEARLQEHLWGDDEPPYEIELTGQARPNVLFEAGMAMGRSEDRTVLVELGTLRPFSDVAGRHTIRLDGSSKRRQELAQRLEAAGCPVNLEGTDWHTAGDFESALQESIQSSSNHTSIADSEVSVAATSGISDEAIVLLKEAAKDSDGAIGTARTFGGMSIQTHGKEFGESGNARLEAMWKGALSELVDSGFVNDETGKGQVFRVTREGFEAADSIKSK